MKQLGSAPRDKGDVQPSSLLTSCGYKYTWHPAPEIGLRTSNSLLQVVRPEKQLGGEWQVEAGQQAFSKGRTGSDLDGFVPQDKVMEHWPIGRSLSSLSPAYKDTSLGWSWAEKVSPFEEFRPSQSSENRVHVNPHQIVSIAMRASWGGGEELSCHTATVCKQKGSALKMAKLREHGVLVLKQKAQVVWGLVLPILETQVCSTYS